MATDFIVKAPDFTKLGASIQLAAAQEFDRAVSDEVTLLKARTISGRDFENKPFKGYSTKKSKKPGSISYKDYRRIHGYVYQYVNLTITGKMIKAITYNISASGNFLTALIFFQSPAEAQKARDNQDLERTFFRLGKEQIARIVKRLKGALR